MEMSYIFKNDNFKVKLMFLLLVLFLPVNNLSNTYSNQSEINLIIKGQGNINILNETYYKEPSEVIVNNVTKPLCNKSCNFDDELNYVTIKFDGFINSTENMFYGLTNIVDIDLSNLDTYKVLSMESMFRNCSDLEKITFGNINTSSVINMRQLFFGCSMLTSIDLSNFDT